MANNNNLLLLLAVGALIFVVMFGVPGQEADDGDEVPVDISTCESTTTPDLDINAYDIDNPGTALTEATNLYRKVGDKAWSTFTQGTAIQNLEVGEQYEIVMGISTTDFTDNSYGPSFTSDEISCKELEVMDQALYQDAAETTLTATFYNKNHDASAETFTAGQTKNVYLEFEAGSDTYFGNPNIGDLPNVLCMNLNKTEWDKPDQVTFEGEELSSVGVPQRHSVGTGLTAYCYEFPVVTDNGQEVKVRLDADDSTAPIADATASLYAGNWFINDDGELESGVETDEGSAVGTDAADTLTMDFT